MKQVTTLALWRALLGLMLCGAAAGSAAVTVHTWVDAKGVRHFADAPPPENSGAASSEITIDAGTTPLADDVDYYSISNQWQRLRAERESRDALALEQRRIDAAAPLVPPVAQDDEPRAVIYPNYYGLPPRFGPPYPAPLEEGRPSPRNAFVNRPPPVWPRER